MSGKPSKEIANNIVHHIVMFYILFAIPSGVGYLLMMILTDLRGKTLFSSFLPVALVLFFIYIFYLIQPQRFANVLRRAEKQSSKEDSI